MKALPSKTPTHIPNYCTAQPRSTCIALAICPVLLTVLACQNLCAGLSPAKSCPPHAPVVAICAPHVAHPALLRGCYLPCECYVSRSRGAPRLNNPSFANKIQFCCKTPLYPYLIPATSISVDYGYTVLHRCFKLPIMG